MDVFKSTKHIIDNTSRPCILSIVELHETLETKEFKNHISKLKNKLKKDDSSGMGVFHLTLYFKDLPEEYQEIIPTLPAFLEYESNSKFDSFPVLLPSNGNKTQLIAS